MKCPNANCRAELKIVPAGISKTTGKKYPAFYACPNKCNLRGLMDTRVDAKTPVDTQNTPQNRFSPQTPQTLPSENKDRINAFNELIMKLDNIERKVQLLTMSIDKVIEELMPKE